MSTEAGRTIAVLTYRAVLNKAWDTVVQLASYSGSAEAGVYGRTVTGRTINAPARSIVSLELV